MNQPYLFSLSSTQEHNPDTTIVVLEKRSKTLIAALLQSGMVVTSSGQSVGFEPKAVLSVLDRLLASQNRMIALETQKLASLSNLTSSDEGARDNPIKLTSDDGYRDSPNTQISDEGARNTLIAQIATLTVVRDALVSIQNLIKSADANELVRISQGMKNSIPAHQIAA